MKKTLLFAAGALGIMITGCGDSKFKGFTKAENGLYYKFFTHSEDGKKVMAGDNIYIRYVISKQTNDSLIVNSKDVSRDGSGYTNFIFKKSSFAGSFEDGMMMMTKGDSAEFLVLADSFFLKSFGANELPKGFKPGDYLKGLFMVKDVMLAAEVEAKRKKEMEERQAMMKEMEAKEKPEMDKFIEEHKIKVKPTASGLYYIETKKGNGASPQATDVVKVHYTGKFLDGKVFDSSLEKGEPIEFPLNSVIHGWTEGLQMMKRGGKASLLVPSAIAYGPNGYQGVPPYAPLYFDIELIDFKPAPQQNIPAGTTK